MSKLTQLLSYLEQPDVSELVFRSGAPAVMHSGTRVHPLTIGPLQEPQLLRIFEGTPLLAHVPRGPGVPAQMLRLELLGTHYQVTLSGSGAPLEIRVAKPRAVRTTWPDLPGNEVPEGMGRRPRKRSPAPPPIEPRQARDTTPTVRDLPLCDDRREPDDARDATEEVLDEEALARIPAVRDQLDHE